MRILHIITSLDIGGAERLLVDILPRLRDGGNNEVELLLFNGRVTHFYTQLQAQGIKIYSLGMSEKMYSPFYILKLVQYIGQYDIIHTHNTPCQLFTPIAKALSLTRKPLVTTEHNTSNRRRDKKWLKPIDQWMYHQYHAIICISDQTRTNLVKHIGNHSNIYLIDNGIDVQRFYRPIKKLHANQNEYLVTMVAGFRKQKDQDTLLRAMQRLPKNYRLQLVGSGTPYENREPELRKLCTELSLEDRVNFMGVREDVANILGGSDVAVMSSHWEGFGLAAVEAMAAGCPVVASNVPGLREVVNGAGMLFPCGDDQALATCIRNLCEHPDQYREVAQKGQERAKQYDISVMVKKYLEVYQKIM